MGNSYWNKHDNIKANREGRIVPEQVAHLKKTLVNGVLAFVAAVGICGFVTFAAFPTSPAMAIFFGLVGLVVAYLSGSYVLSTKKILDGAGSVLAIEGKARREIVRAGVRLYLDDEFIYCSNQLAHKFEEGKTYRIYVAMPTRLLLSAEQM